MVALWRTLGEFPETLAWETLQWDSLHAYRANVADAMRAAGNKITVGAHVQHSASHGDFPWRAGEDPSKIKRYADWVKPSIYAGVSGKRYKDILDIARTTYLMDCDEEAAHQTLSAWFGRSPENGRKMLGENPAAQAPFSPAWCEAETRRFAEGCAPLPTYAGLGIGIPGGEQVDTPERIAAYTRRPRPCARLSRAARP